MAVSALRQSRDDPRQFGPFYRENAQRVTQFFASRLADPEAALDLTAETFAVAYESRQRFRGSSDEQARAWLFTIAGRQLARYLRKGYARRTALERLGFERIEPQASELAEIEELAQMETLRAVLAQQLAELPSGLRDAVRLRVLDQLTYPEVAERLAITETAARMRVSRALSRLRAGLTPMLLTEG